MVLSFGVWAAEGAEPEVDGIVELDRPYGWRRLLFERLDRCMASTPLSGQWVVPRISRCRALLMNGIGAQPLTRTWPTRIYICFPIYLAVNLGYTRITLSVIPWGKTKRGIFMSMDMSYVAGLYSENQKTFQYSECPAIYMSIPFVQDSTTELLQRSLFIDNPYQACWDIAWDYSYMVDQIDSEDCCQFSSLCQDFRTSCCRVWFVQVARIAWGLSWSRSASTFPLE